MKFYGFCFSLALTKLFILFLTMSHYHLTRGLNADPEVICWSFLLHPNNKLKSVIMSNVDLNFFKKLFFLQWQELNLGPDNARQEFSTKL